MTTNQNGGIDNAGDWGSDAFTPEEQAAIERMQQDAPMPTRNEGGEPPADGGAPAAPAPRSDQQQASAGDDDLADGEEEITIDGKGRGHDQNGQFVSKSALLRVREQSKQYRTELEAERAARAKLEGRFEILAEALNAPQAPAGDGKASAGKQQQPANPWEEEDIDPAVDIFSAFDQQKRRNAYERQQREAMAKAGTQREQKTAAVNAYIADAKRLAGEHIANGELVTLGEGDKARQVPAFQAAYLHLVGVRDAQLQALGIADKAARDARIAAEEGELIEEAIAAKRSPAEMILALATAAGFKMPAKGAGNGAGQQKTQKQLDAERHLEQVNNGMRSMMSLSGRGGNPPPTLNAAQIAAMGEDEFAALVAQMGEDQFARRYLGAGAEY
jgi:hypothetical protein